MANNSDVTIRGLQIAAELNIDASADIISGQLNDLATKVNSGSQKLKLNVDINMGQPAVMSKQLNSQLQAAQAQVKPLDLSKFVNMNDAKAVRAEVDKIASEMAKLQGFDYGKATVKVDKKSGKLLSADIQYYKDGVNQAITDTIRLVNATKKVPEHYKEARTFSDNYKKSIEQAAAAQKKINDEIAKQQEATWKLREEEERRDSAVKKSLASYESQVYYQQKSSEASAYNNKVSERKTALSEYDSFAKSENAEIASLNKQVDAFVAKLKQAGLYTGSFPQDIRALRAEIEGIPSQTILPSGEYVDGIKSKLTGLVGTYDQIISRQQIENEKFQQYYNLVSQKNALEKQLVGVSGNPNKVNEEANIRDRIAAKDKEINDARAKINLSEAQLIKLIAQEQVQREKIGSEQAKVADITEKQRISQQVADRQANAERDRALATLKLMEAQYPKMKGTAFQAQFDGIEQGLQDQTMSGKEANVQLVMLRENLQAAGLAGQTFGQKITAAFQKFGQYVTVSTIVLAGIRATKQMISNVVELDAAMVDLQVASGKSYDEISKLIDSYHDLGQEMGATTIEVAKSADTWLRQGYSIAESNELIRASMILSKLGQIDSAEAAKYLTGAMKGYRLSVDEALGVVDKLAATDMEAAVSAGGIATAMAETAVSADIAGVSMDRLIGYLAKVAEVKCCLAA